MRADAARPIPRAQHRSFALRSTSRRTALYVFGMMTTQQQLLPQQAQAQQRRQQYCLVKNGELLACSQSSGAWLQSAPRGAYTTARTVGDGAHVLKLSSHVQRLAQSANLMLQADHQTVTSEDAPPPAPFTAQQLRPHVLTGLAAVISAFRSGACTGGGVSSAASVTSGSGTHINDEDREGSGSGNGDGNRGGEDGSGGTAAAAAASLSGQRVVEQAPQHQLKLTMLMTWDAPGRFDLWCHGEALPNRPRPPVKLEVKGLPRTNARAKDSEWVRQRRALEESKPSDVNEVVLCSSEGHLMEGLSSNFFVLHDGAVVTADEGVLGGTIREIVLQVCKDLGLPVRLEAPLLSDIERWQGAFISSTSRLLLPADELRWALPGHGGPGGTEKVRVFKEQHPVIRQLEAAVMDRIMQESEPVPVTPPVS